MNNERIKEWIKAALIRAVKTVAQAALAMIGVSTFMSEVDWSMVASASILAGIMSILTSIVGGLPEIEKEMDKPEVPHGYFEKEYKEDKNGDSD